MLLEENRALAHRLFELHDEGDLGLLDAVVSVDCIFHMPKSAEDTKGLGQLKAHIAETRMAFPDIEHIITDTVAEGDTVAVRLTVRGTQKGEYGGFAPTGEQVEFTVMNFLRVSGGKIVEGWCEWDFLGFMQQLGMELRPKV